MTRPPNAASAPTTLSAPPRTGPTAGSAACTITRLPEPSPSSRRPFCRSLYVTSGTAGFTFLALAGVLCFGLVRLQPFAGLFCFLGSLFVRFGGLGGALLAFFFLRLFLAFCFFLFGFFFALRLFFLGLLFLLRFFLFFFLFFWLFLFF